MHSLELAIQGYNIIAIDISDEFIDSLKKKVTAQNLSNEVIHANILSLESQDSLNGASCIATALVISPIPTCKFLYKKFPIF